jgi:hypothetical protein
MCYVSIMGGLSDVRHGQRRVVTMRTGRFTGNLVNEVLSRYTDMACVWTSAHHPDLDLFIKHPQAGHRQVPQPKAL